MTAPKKLERGDRVRTPWGRAVITHIGKDDWYSYRYLRDDNLLSDIAGYIHRSRLRKLPARGTPKSSKDEEIAKKSHNRKEGE